ncbi:hypothetical protein K435DRAFT_960534 [Dendrothele bispora CBS 962.96]|uniref:Uncharacterized protein n=1 Tax=Dendrothele bispora (strain CBS 962.96) TaxID=1314807 RepID=A0A4S8MV38_DENBC|nr:hypothetical protein K435DRAFT_960534 [Dendrothele bispora CBS 962.96]
MLARLSKSTACALGLTTPRTGSQRLLGQSSTPEDDSEDVVHVIRLEILMQPLHEFLTPWHHLARTLAPVYHNLQHIFIDDVDRVAQLLLDLEPVSEHDYMYMDYDDYDDRDVVEVPNSSSCPELNPLQPTSSADALRNRTEKFTGEPLSISKSSSSSSRLSPSIQRFANNERELPPRKQRRSTYLTQPIVIPSSHPSAPTIIITPCLSDSEKASSLPEASFASRVPIQDSAFRSRLTVPRHPTFNCIFPPMRMSLSLSFFSSSSSSSSNSPPISSCDAHANSMPMIFPPLPSFHPLVETWRWKDGHWQAVLPGLEEQMKRGIFSRVVSMHGGMRRKGKVSNGYRRASHGRSGGSQGTPVR